MKFTLGLVLTLVGLAIVLYGFGSALKGLTAIYSNAIESPLDEPSLGEGSGRGDAGSGGTTGEKAISEKMIDSVMIGAIGLPPLIVGSVLLKWAMFSRWRRKVRERQAMRRV